MKTIITKLVSLLMVLAFITGQTVTGFAFENLSPSLLSDTGMNPQRTGYGRNMVARELEPGAIGNGKPLIDLVSGDLPEKLELKDENEKKEIHDVVYEAIDMAIRLYIENRDKVPERHRKRAEATLADLIAFRNNLDRKLYLFNGDVKGAEDYLLGFSSGELIGLDVGLISKLYSISTKRLAQYLFHENTPEHTTVKGREIDREDHRSIYRELQSAIFGEDEVIALKRDLRNYIDISLQMSESENETVPLSDDFKTYLDEVAAAFEGKIFKYDSGIEYGADTDIKVADTDSFSGSGVMLRKDGKGNLLVTISLKDDNGFKRAEKGWGVEWLALIDKETDEIVGVKPFGTMGRVEFGGLSFEKEYRIEVIREISLHEELPPRIKDFLKSHSEEEFRGYLEKVNEMLGNQTFSHKGNGDTGGENWFSRSHPSNSTGSGASSMDEFYLEYDFISEGKVNIVLDLFPEVRFPEGVPVWVELFDISTNESAAIRLCDRDRTNVVFKDMVLKEGGVYGIRLFTGDHKKAVKKEDRSFGYDFYKEWEWKKRVYALNLKKDRDNNEWIFYQVLHNTGGSFFRYIKQHRWDPYYLGQFYHPKEVSEYREAYEINENEIRCYAEYWKNNLVRLLSKHPEQTFVLALDTDIGRMKNDKDLEKVLADKYNRKNIAKMAAWIRKKHQIQMRAIWEAAAKIKALKDAEGKPLFPNLIIKKASASNGRLMREIQEEIDDKNVKKENIFVVGRQANINNNQFESIKGSAWITGIEDREKLGYYPVFEAATLTIMAASGADIAAIENFYAKIAEKPVARDALKEMLTNRVVTILPRMEIYDLNLLQELNEAVANIYLSV